MNAKEIEALAKIIRHAFLTIYVRDNPFHDNPEFKTLNKLLKCELALAAELLKLGIRLPEPPTPPGRPSVVREPLVPRKRDLPGQSLLPGIEPHEDRHPTNNASQRKPARRASTRSVRPAK